jgi:hypothetical protein
VRPLCGNVHLLLCVHVCEEWCVGVTTSVIGRSWLPGCMGVGDVCGTGERGVCGVYSSWLVVAHASCSKS